MSDVSENLGEVSFFFIAALYLLMDIYFIILDLQ